MASVRPQLSEESFADLTSEQIEGLEDELLTAADSIPGLGSTEIRWEVFKRGKRTADFEIEVHIPLEDANSIPFCSDGAGNLVRLDSLIQFVFRTTLETSKHFPNGWIPAITLVTNIHGSYKIFLDFAKKPAI